MSRPPMEQRRNGQKCLRPGCPHYIGDRDLYCSDRCRNVMRMRRMRARMKLAKEEAEEDDE